MAAALILKPSPSFSAHPLSSPPHLFHAPSLFRLSTPFFRPSTTIFSPPFHHHNHTSSSFVTVLSTIATGPDRITRFESPDSESDLISSFNDRILKQEFTKRNSGRYKHDSGDGVTDEEVDKYTQLVKQQQQRGLRELKRGRLRSAGGSGNENAGFSYKVDPFSLKEADYVVHKKVGIDRVFQKFPLRPLIMDNQVW
ncbi:hypothetical protein Hanom_Chr09g00823771 [Helianthus anomalus]